MSATSTHDSKRSEDTRARISVLSEIPDEWEEAITRWYRMNAGARKRIEEAEVPDPNEEYLLYQTLVGIWPAEKIEAAERMELARRVQAYMDKAVKEAKLHTSWMNVNEERDHALNEFLAAILAEGSEFVDDLEKFLARVARASALAALSQTLLKIASPGVPDFYQGTELWTLNLVDPDNRRPVDFTLRRAMLGKLRDSARRDPMATVCHLLRNLGNGAIKMYLTSRALEFRRENHELFMRGEYVPLDVIGPRAPHVIAFARAHAGRRVLAVCGRFFTDLPEAPPLPVDPKVWTDTFVSVGDGDARFTNVFSGATIRVVKGSLALEEVFAQMPVALLESA